MLVQITQVVLRGIVGVEDGWSVVCMFWDQEEDQKNDRAEEGADDLELRSPAVVHGDVSSEDWHEVCTSQKAQVVESNSLASLVDLYLVLVSYSLTLIIALLVNLQNTYPQLTKEQLFQRRPVPDPEEPLHPRSYPHSSRVRSRFPQ